MTNKIKQNQNSRELDIHLFGSQDGVMGKVLDRALGYIGTSGDLRGGKGFEEFSELSYSPHCEVELT
ncbi:MAG: hypothetical protein R3351_09055 [Nitrospirales bacterium]|nr:hypothetical protein [Nitrospirales bacterium]